MNKPTWTPSRAVIAQGKRNGCVLYVTPGSYLEQECGDISDQLGDLGLDDAPTGISIWEGTHKGGGYNGHTGDYDDCYPVGTFRAPADDEWTAIREGRNPWGEETADEPDVDDPNESAESWGFGDHRSDNGNPDFEVG
jgi:hypothetical protein